jgi:tetratricopeptide (TPR) repeat protein
METEKSRQDIKKLLEDALVFHRAGEYDNSVSLYRKILAIDPMNEIANNNLGIIYVMKENYDKAIEHFSKVIKLYPASIDAFFNLGKAFMMKDDYTNASKVLEKANKLAPKDKQILKNLAYSYKCFGDFERALINYRQVLNFDENDTTVMYEIAEIYYLMENYERASEFCLKILNRTPLDWKARGLLGDSFFYLKKFNESIEIMKSLISDYPNSVQFREKLADYYLEMGAFSDALHQYETILSKEPGNINFLNKYREIKDLIYNNGEKSFMAELESSYEEKLKLKAKKFFEKEDYNGLVREFTRELINNSNNLFLLKSIARAYCRLDNYEEASKYYERYLENDKKDFEITYEYATVLNKLSKFMDSKKYAEQVIKGGEVSEDILLLQADNLCNMGMLEEAIANIEKHAHILNSPAIYKKLGNFYKEAGNHTAAYNTWLKATKLFTDNSFNMLLAKISCQDKNYKQAFKHIKKYTENDTSDFSGLEFLSRVYFNLKKPREAFQVWGEIIEKRPKNDNDIFIKARTLLYSERLDEANKQLDLIESKFGTQVRFKFLKGLAYLMAEDYNRCIEIWEECSNEDEDEFLSEFMFIVRYFDKDKLKNLLKRWSKYENEIISVRSNI